MCLLVLKVFTEPGCLSSSWPRVAIATHTSGRLPPKINQYCLKEFQQECKVTVQHSHRTQEKQTGIFRMAL